MNQKGKLILLGTLMAVLVVVAAIVLTRPKPGKPAKRKPPVTAREQAAKGPKNKAAANAPAEAAKEAVLPAVADIKALDAWLGADLGDAPVTVSKPQVLGLALTAQAGAVAADRSVPGAVAFEAPPQLEGILWRGRTGRALIEGEAYGVGDRVSGTSFRIAALSRNEVTLKSEDDREVRINLYSTNEQ
jgi:hypothetical protein